jgi:hypothetical protein
MIVVISTIKYHAYDRNGILSYLCNLGAYCTDDITKVRNVKVCYVPFDTQLQQIRPWE